LKFNRIEEGAALILKGLAEDYGLDLTDPNLTDTPKRIAKAYAEIFSGIFQTEKQIEEILKSKFPADNCDEMILSGNNVVFSMCPHHVLPVEYTIDIAYIPSSDGFVLGISKLSRVAEILAKRLVLQEQLTIDIGKAIEKINPKGVAVKVKGEHFCVKMRGVKKQSFVVTSYTSGVFRNDPATRAEFFSLVKE
jgi:GTP cyclohydrolase I